MSITPEQRRALEELGVERLRMRLRASGDGAGAEVFQVKPPISRYEAEQWMVDELNAEKRRDGKEKSDTLWWAKAAAIASVVVPLLIFALERLFK